MKPIQEMTAWSTDEIVAETRALLPMGLSAEFGWDEENRCWIVQIFDGDGAVVWDHSGIDCRTTYLSAYGWVAEQQVPAANPSGLWSRRRELTVEIVRKQAMGVSDPPDLDPDEIDLVYKQTLKGEK